MNYSFNANTPRVRLERLEYRLGRWLRPVLIGLIAAATLGMVYLAARQNHLALSLLGIDLLLISKLLWLRLAPRQLAKQQPAGTTQLELLLGNDLVGLIGGHETAAELWAILSRNWRARFVYQRLGIGTELAASWITASPPTIDEIWNATAAVAHTIGTDHWDGGTVAAGLLTASEGLKAALTTLKLAPEDVVIAADWLRRGQIHYPKAFYGGFGRDWAVGFTRLLDRYGQNLSRQLEGSGGGLALHERQNQIETVVRSLSDTSASLVLVGEVGIGKTSLLYGVADHLLQGQGGAFAHYQIVSLNASILVASTRAPGELEQLVLALLAEGAAAGNIIIALDEAQLFFGHGTGAVDLSQVLLPLLQGGKLRLILTLTPADWQRLRATNVALAGLLTPLVLKASDRTETLQILGQRALQLESKSSHVTGYTALTEAYALSERYLPDEAQPGRALKLLESAAGFAQNGAITAVSVQMAVESQFGVKVGAAGAVEKEALLGLEDHIHQRMINQTRAVSVVAAALRRARAGVANPKRPLGSFLFLGPTGVGKTELAKSLAAICFGTESNLVRLDMSEYQSTSDVARLLADGTSNNESLLSKIRRSPYSVVLLDEIEKAHANVLNLLLQMLDEGTLTDTSGKVASFKDAIIIATSNAGADEIRTQIEAGRELESFEQEFTDQLIAGGSFKPELLNRFDEIVLFRPLNQVELVQVVGLLIAEVNQSLASQKITVTLTEAAATALVTAGYDARLGARPMRRMVQRTVQDLVAKRILTGTAQPGSTIALDVADLGL